MEGEKQAGESRYILISDLASQTPYSQAYLSLLARQGKIDARKIGRNWHVSREGLQEYLQKQGIPVFIPKTFPSRSKLRKPLDASLVMVQQKPADYSKFFDKEKNNEEPAPAAKTEEHIHPEGAEHALRVRTLKSDTEGVAPKFEIEEKEIKKEAERGKREKFEPRVAESADVFERFVNVLEARFKTRGLLSSLDKFSKQSVRTPTRLMAVMISVVVLIFLVVGGFSFGNVDQVALQVKKAIEDAQTLQGHTPGTHANDVLLLDKEGKISIYGHVETKGQLRSYIEQGIAPIVVTSTTTVENLSADYLDNVSAEEFTLAFVTKNGNVTYEKVYIEVGVEVGETLLVKSADKLAQAIIEGNLSTLGSVSVGKDLIVNGQSTLAGGADIFTKLMVRGDAEISNLIVAQRGQIKEGGLTVSGHTQLNTLGVSGGASIDNLGIAAKLSVGVDIDLGNSTADELIVNASSTFLGTINATGNVFVRGETILGDADGDSLEIRGKSVNFGSTATTSIGVNTGLNVDNGTLVLDARANRVGIGTSSPGTLLGVAGDTAVWGTLTVDGLIKGDILTATSSFSSGSGSTSSPAFSFLAEPHTGITSGGADNMLSFITGGSV